MLNYLSCYGRTREAAASVARDGGGGACSKTRSSKCFSFNATPYVPPVSCMLPQTFADQASHSLRDATSISQQGYVLVMFLTCRLDQTNPSPSKSTSLQG